ncbi:MAG: hypothetical protein V9G19_05520 [Tetrasphaera sp.]
MRDGVAGAAARGIHRLETGEQGPVFGERVEGPTQRKLLRLEGAAEDQCRAQRPPVLRSDLGGLDEIQRRQLGERPGDVLGRGVGVRDDGFEEPLTALVHCRPSHRFD